MKVPGLAIAACARQELDSLGWRDTRSTGVGWIDLGTTEDGTKTVLIRMLPGCGYPSHRHIGPEDVLVLSGGYRDGDGSVHTAGQFVRYAAGSVHSPVALESEACDGEACVLFAVAHRGTVLVGGSPAQPEGLDARATAGRMEGSDR